MQLQTGRPSKLYVDASGAVEDRLESQSLRTVNGESVPVAVPLQRKLLFGDINTPRAKSKKSRAQLLRLMKVLGLVVLAISCIWVVLPHLIRGNTLDDASRYTIVCDAGSTGTRLYVFSFDETSKFKMERGDKITPGLSSFAHTPTKVGAYLRGMFERAVKLIPTAALRKTGVYIRATAGMRLVEAALQHTLYDEIAYTAFPSFRLPLALPRDHLSTISGEDEAWYAFLAVNYLTDRIGQDLQPLRATRPLAGALDLGGKSTQIVFDNTRDKPMSRRRREEVYAASFLRYGTDTMLRTIGKVFKRRQRQSEQFQKEKVVLNPCLFKGFSLPEYNFLVNGTGDTLGCAKVIQEVIDADLRAFADVPEVRGEFYALSAYYYSLDAMRAMLAFRKSKNPEDTQSSVDDFLEHWPRPSISEILQAIESFCTLPWGFVQENMGSVHPLTPNFKVSHRCFEVTYVTVLLRHAYGFDVSERKVTFTLSIKDTEVEWAIGAFLEDQATERLAPMSLSSLSLNNFPLIFGAIIVAIVVLACRKSSRSDREVSTQFKRKTSSADCSYEQKTESFSKG